MHKLVLFVSLLALTSAQDKNLVELAKSLGATTLVSFLEKAGLNDTIATGGPFTVFGPTNDAFAALPSDLVNDLNNNMTLLQETLKYHVINAKVMSGSVENDKLVDSLSTGNKIRTNVYGTNPKVITATGSKVTVADQEATNGVIHVVSKVMLPPSGNIVAYVSGNSDFSTLLKAVTTADLGGTLGGDGPFTLFAPNNAAFAKLDQNELNKILADKPRLTSLLKSHLVSGTVYSSGLSDGMKVESAESGQPITVKIANGVVSVNDAKVTKADESVTNGVIHVIDTVIVPRDTSSASAVSVSMALMIFAAFLGVFNL